MFYTKTKDMKITNSKTEQSNTATLSISKVIDVITPNEIYQSKISDLISECDKFDSVIISGLVKLKKYNKIMNLLSYNNYIMVCINWKRVNEIADDCIDFSICFYKKLIMNTITKTINARNSNDEKVFLTFRWGYDLQILSVRNSKKEIIFYDNDDFQVFYDYIVDSVS